MCLTKSAAKYLQHIICNKPCQPKGFFGSNIHFFIAVPPRDTKTTQNQYWPRSTHGFIWIHNSGFYATLFKKKCAGHETGTGPCKLFRNHRTMQRVFGSSLGDRLQPRTQRLGCCVAGLATVSRASGCPAIVWKTHRMKSLGESVFSICRCTTTLRLHMPWP